MLRLGYHPGGAGAFIRGRLMNCFTSNFVIGRAEKLCGCGGLFTGRSPKCLRCRQQDSPGAGGQAPTAAQRGVGGFNLSCSDAANRNGSHAEIFCARIRKFMVFKGMFKNA